MTDYLDSVEFGEGEFEAGQGRFEQLISNFALELKAPLSEALRAQATGAAARAWLDPARRTLDALLHAPTPSAMDEASLEVLADLRKALEQDPELSEAEIAEEVDACSRETAQLVLSLWLEKLHEAEADPDGLQLNANMLPGTHTFEEILRAAEFHGVERTTVVKALRSYHKDLRDRSLRERSPIALGPRLFVVPDKKNPDRPYRLFAAQMPATAFMRAQKNERKRVVDFTVWQQQITEFLDSVVPRGPGGEPLVIPLPVSANWSPVASLKRLPTLEVANNLSTLDEDAPERLFAEAVELGVDMVSAGIGVDDVQATQPLRIQGKLVRDHLRAYAQVRNLPSRAVSGAYVIAVRTSMECLSPNEGFSGQAADPAMEPAGLSRFLASNYHVNDSEARQLMEDSYLGIACCVPIAKTTLR